MQKIAYSTLAIAVPVILTGCDDDDSIDDSTDPTPPTPVNCTILNEADCKDSVTGATCNWEENDRVAASCSDVDGFLNNQPVKTEEEIENCNDLGGIRAQVCENSLFGQNSNPALVGSKNCSALKNAKLSYDDIDSVVENDNAAFVSVKFQLFRESDFASISENPDKLCTGYFKYTANTDQLRLCADETCSTDEFQCGSQTVSISPELDYTVTRDDFARNKIYDASLLETCTAEPLCGMSTEDGESDGECIPVEKYCEQFDADSCPTEEVKADVTFTRMDIGGVDAEVITSALLCEHEVKEVRDSNDVVTTPAKGCQTVSDLEIATCEASPFPTNGYTDTITVGADQVQVRNVCKSHLADDKDWTEVLKDDVGDAGRPIYRCTDLDDLASCSPADRHCVSAGSSQPENVDQVCAVPRNFTCDVVANAEFPTCSYNSTSICSYDDGNRDVCVKNNSNSTVFV